MTREEQVLIRGKVFLYKVKAPFVPSGKSVLGALEYRESDDKVRCHECGEWKVRLQNHLREHAVPPNDYRQKHGLNKKTPLCGLRYLATLSARAKQQGIGKSSNALRLINRKSIEPRSGSGLRDSIGAAVSATAEAVTPTTKRDSRASEYRNERGTCQAQILGRLKALGDKLGRTPTIKEIRSDGICEASAIVALNVSGVRELLALAGMAPRMDGHEFRYTKEILIELLRSFSAKHGRPPNTVDMDKTERLPSSLTFRKHFGSIQKAYDAAGIQKLVRPTRESTIVGLQAFHRKFGELPRAKGWPTTSALPSRPTIIALFGSMAAAYEAAGLTVFVKSKAEILREARAIQKQKKLYRKPLKAITRYELMQKYGPAQNA